MTSKNIQNLATALWLFLATPASHAKFQSTGAYSAETGNLAQDTYNALVGDAHQAAANGTDKMLQDWDTILNTETWGQSFVDALVAFRTDMLALTTVALKETAIDGWVNDSNHFDSAGSWVGTSQQKSDLPEIILEDGGAGDIFKATIGGIQFTVGFAPETAASQEHVMTNTTVALRNLIAADTTITSRAIITSIQNEVLIEPKAGEQPLLVEIQAIDNGTAPVAYAFTYNPGNNNPPPVHPLTPVVSNVTAAQVPNTKLMEIFFDLAVEDNHPCTITVKWSIDNGATYPHTATAVSGKAGPGILPGVMHGITWDMEIDWNQQFTQTGRIKVIASRDPFDGTYGTAANSPTE